MDVFSHSVNQNIIHSHLHVLFNSFEDTRKLNLTGTHFVQENANPDSFTGNLALTARVAQTRAGPVYFNYHLGHGVFDGSSPNFLPANLPGLEILFWPATDSSWLQYEKTGVDNAGANVTYDYSFKLSECELQYELLKLPPKSNADFFSKFLKNPIFLSYPVLDVKQFNIPINSLQYSQSNIFISQTIPNRLVLALCTSKRALGDAELTNLRFQQHNLKSVSFSSDGRLLKSYDNLDREHSSMYIYNDFLELMGCGQQSLLSPAPIKHTDFEKSYFFIPFSPLKCICASQELHLSGKDSTQELRIDLSFSRQVPENLSLYIISFRDLITKVYSNATFENHVV